jgi:hypothetical protein
MFSTRDTTDTIFCKTPSVVFFLLPSPRNTRGTASCGFYRYICISIYELLGWLLLRQQPTANSRSRQVVLVAWGLPTAARAAALLRQSKGMAHIRWHP